MPGRATVARPGVPCLPIRRTLGMPGCLAGLALLLGVLPEEHGGEKAEAKMLSIKAFRVWLLMLLAAFLNGALRDLLIVPYLGDSVGHVISVFVLSGVIFGLAYLFVTAHRPLPARTLFRIGLRSYWIPGSWHLRMVSTDIIPFDAPCRAANHAGQPPASPRGCPGFSALTRAALAGGRRVPRYGLPPTMGRYA